MGRISLIMIIGAALALIGLICISGPPRLPWIQTASAMQEDQPTIAKDSVQVTAFTFSVYRKNYDIWSWVPKINYSTTEVQHNPTQSTNPAGQFTWTRWKCTFYSVLPWDKTANRTEGIFGPMYLFSENPGDYESKVVYQGHLIRSMKFAVDADGKIVDNGIATANKLGSDRVIVPVQIIGELDGSWDRMAWKTEALYGNPLKGFSVP